MKFCITVEIIFSFQSYNHISNIMIYFYQRDLLKNEQNQEEMVLNLLWDLSCQSSVSFPSTVSGASFHFLSRTSLHSVEDHSSMDVKSVWDDIRLHLRRFLVNKLQSHNEINNLQQKILLKNQCIQQLLFLYTESEVTSK